MRFEILALDIDGTVFSSEDIILETYLDSVSEYSQKSGENIQLPSHERIMAEIGKPVKTIFRNLLPDLHEQGRDQISDRVLSLLVEKILSGRGKFYDGIAETISELHNQGFRIAACSNGRYAYVEAILRKLDVLQYFLPIVVLDNEQRKVKGDILLHYLDVYNLESKQILMVGDRHSDWEAAQVALTPFAFCEYGHAEPNEIPSYDFALKTPSDLKKIVLSQK
ncbi:HAD family hydrolase [Leptospira sp. GIMC2001]|uniref:HAD family hydrolase n=1 Tax=Leptospira sp. GIMC2001 TaxID=1513297 RepID=UPI00234B8AC9|nr:HAD family hydrolase [Leptospira sp. GIMC2001]WCL47951.1 HAD family hydrolase [Leptospira sp. GIMC2001]